MTDEDFEEMRTLTDAALERSGERAWRIADLPWHTLYPEELTDEDRTIVRFLTFVEDHIPAYLTFALGAFPTTGDLDTPTYLRNRQYTRFLINWAHDEDKHATALSRYQVAAEMTDEARLAADLAEAGRKSFALPYEDPLELFVYSFLQEKATQLFYRHYQDVVTEPVLRDLLARLARDEARHFAFYSHLVESSLRRTGPKALLGVKNVLATFRMPLEGVLDGYWRMGLAAVDRVGHDHTEAYDAVGKLVRQFTGVWGTPDADDLDQVIRAAQRMP